MVIIHGHDGQWGDSRGTGEDQCQWCQWLAGLHFIHGDFPARPSLIGGLPGLVNFYQKLWKITMRFLWVNPLFRLGHGFNRYATNYQRVDFLIQIFLHSSVKLQVFTAWDQVDQVLSGRDLRCESFPFSPSIVQTRCGLRVCPLKQWHINGHPAI